jgi:hypothetical protein
MRYWTLFLLLAFPAAGNGQAILNVERLRNEESAGLTGRLSSSVSLKTGNTEIVQIGGSLGLGFLAGNHWVRGFAGLDRLKKGSQEILDNKYFHLRYNYLLREHLRTFHFLQLQTNQNLFLKRRLLLGSGLRYRLAGGGETGLDVGGGVMLETERLDQERLGPGEASNTETLRMANLLVGSGPIGDGSKWTAVVYYQPALDGFEDYRLLGEAGLSVNIINSLDLTVDLTWRHDSRTPAGLKEDDLGLKTGISLEIG